MTVSAALLAGGKSSRMGQDKATILFRGAALWKTQLDLLRRLQSAEIFVSAQTDPAWRPPDVDFVPDDQPSRGPFSGIAATLVRIATDHLLVLGIDMPFMTEKYLRKLCNRIEPGRGVVPIIGDRAEPLAALYPRDAGPEFSRALSSDDFSLQPLVRELIALGKLQPLEVGPEELALFRNLNEPHDLDPA
jgi:molybdopterin-guanine dinucleotide biosynthesis protein A